jgi:hypothetical protein
MTTAAPQATSRPSRPLSDVGADQLYELRTYRVAAGRMQEEMDRALSCILSPEEGGLGLFARHGIPEPVAIWRAVAGAQLPCVVFLYPWQSAALRATAFNSFYVDADWRTERARTNDGSEIVDRMDDLLLVGPALVELPAVAIYEFIYAPSVPVAPTAIASFSLLCGSGSKKLSIVAHSSLGEALGSTGTASGPRLLCERIQIRAQL